MQRSIHQAAQDSLLSRRYSTLQYRLADIAFLAETRVRSTCKIQRLSERD